MVVRTPPLSSLRRGLLPQIHLPLPLNKRESQKLLETITTSFRKNLDKEHPWEKDIETSGKTKAIDLKSSVDLAESLSSISTTATATKYRPTDRHLRAVLSNPLFVHPRNADLDTSTLVTRHNHFHVFDSAVAKGLMTPRRAAGFLATIRSQLLSESPENLSQRMAASGAGLHVLRWLRSSGQENDLNFLSEPALLRAIIPFLYAEGLEEYAWNWLAQLAARATELEFEKTTGKANAETMSRLMSAMVDEKSRTDMQSPISLDNSFAALTRINHMLPRDIPIATAAVRSTWAKLSWATTVNAWQYPKPSAFLFENFVDIGRPLNLPLDLAHLDLHHPTTPTHSAAIEYLRIRKQVVDDVSNMKPRAQQRVLCLVLDAAERLKRTGQVSDAPWLERLKNTIYDRLNLDILNISNKEALNSIIPLHGRT